MSNPYAPPSADRPTPDEPEDSATGSSGTRHGQQPDPTRPAQPGRAPMPLSGPSAHLGPSGPVEPTEPPDPELVLATGRLVRHFGVWMIAAVLVSLLPLPWGAAALAFVIGAVITGIRALRTAAKGRVGGGLAPLVVVGLALAGMLGLMTLAPLAVWSAQSELQDCMSSAVTVSARSACEQEFEQQSTDQLENWLGSTGS